MSKILQKGKESFLTAAAKSFFNQQFSRYGKLQELELDTESKRIRAVVLPDGEERPIEVKLADYKIERGADGTFFVPGQVEVNRPWLQALYNDLGAGQRIPVPSSIAAFI